METTDINILLDTSFKFEDHIQIKKLDRIYSGYGGVKFVKRIDERKYIIAICDVPIENTQRILDSLSHDISHKDSWLGKGCEHCGILLLPYEKCEDCKQVNGLPSRIVQTSQGEKQLYYESGILKVRDSLYYYEDIADEHEQLYKKDQCCDELINKIVQDANSANNSTENHAISLSFLDSFNKMYDYCERNYPRAIDEFSREEMYYYILGEIESRMKKIYDGATIISRKTKSEFSESVVVISCGTNNSIEIHGFPSNRLPRVYQRCIHASYIDRVVIEACEVYGQYTTV